MLAALGVFLTVIVVAVWSLISQDREIAKFTQDDPSPTPVEGSVPQQEVDGLRARLDTFSERAKTGKQATLSLSIHDLNLIIAHTESGKDYREMIHFTGTRQIRGGGAENDGVKATEGKQLVAKVCLKMNKLKFWGDRYRYLVGEMEFDLRVVPAGLDLIVTGVRVPDKEVPEQFVGTFVNWHWLTPYNEDPELAPIFSAITEVEVMDGGVVLKSGKKNSKSR